MNLYTYTIIFYLYLFNNTNTSYTPLSIIYYY